jgi:hypothetical protein
VTGRASCPVVRDGLSTDTWKNDRPRRRIVYDELRGLRVDVVAANFIRHTTVDQRRMEDRGANIRHVFGCSSLRFLHLVLSEISKSVGNPLVRFTNYPRGTLTAPNRPRRHSLGCETETGIRITSLYAQLHTYSHLPYSFIQLTSRNSTFLSFIHSPLSFLFFPTLLHHIHA